MSIPSRRHANFLVVTLIGFILSTGQARGSDTESPVAESPLAVLAPLEWETDALREGARAFLDVDLRFNSVPKELAGKSFLRTHLLGTRKVCLQAGIVYAITPSPTVKEYTQAPALEQLGFRRVESIAEFNAFEGQWEELPCSVYSKEIAEGERIDIPSAQIVLKSYPPEEDVRSVPYKRHKWVVLVANAPRSNGEIGDLSPEPRSLFSPPLAQDYTVAAQTPNLAYFIHDPGMIRLPNGDLLSFSPCWKRPSRVGKAEGGYLIITKSTDGGGTWRRLPDLPYAEATPFIAQGKLYLFTQMKQHEDVYFTRSDDGGESWAKPVKVLEGPYWNCQTNFVEKDGYIYWVLDQRHQGVVAIAGDLSEDLLDPKAWRASNVLEAVMTPPEFRPSGTRLYATKERERFHDWNLEGNMMLVGDRLRIAARVNPSPGDTPGIAALFDLTDKDGHLILAYDQHYPWPGGQSKFAILHDPVTKLFWMTCNVAAGPLKKGVSPDRRFLMLYFGHDGKNWLPAGCVAFTATPSQSFMYPSMVIDGNDLAILSRTGRESGHFHDANLSTFHRVKDFRSLAWF
ncbi:sialidase family protein [Botrimarina mediterranea]|uniref:BNR/Asp-box repeat protein n=1 Tax=Botrimarina mediterranea TaxID=2528022 RepID=A0A518K7Q7_9BACT|nr:sialidase family protein [Botrimarina mediterranea]QDV73834.1 hypothetical protein Spa11_20330 [Botrimarina mediterranea]QDV78463.1 hypothetical protein K2D_20700 [Planctomycetes bacterium K2D]